MLGAIIGDISGTKYEYQEFLDTRKGVINLERRKSILNPSTKLITPDSFISDDTMLTISIAEAIVYDRNYRDVLKQYGREFGNSLNERKDFFKNAFSPTFIKWSNSDGIENGTSQGNGAAMRVSPVAYLFNDLSTVQNEARKTAVPSHDTPQAIQGAECLASAIFLARQKRSKSEIKEYITKKYTYNLDNNLEELQKYNIFNGTCDVTVPQAIFVFLTSQDFEDSIRKAISIGGDTDTIACMVGSISEAYYGIPKNLRDEAFNLLPQRFKNILINAYKLKNKNENQNQNVKESEYVK